MREGRKWGKISVVREKTTTNSICKALEMVVDWFLGFAIFLVILFRGFVQLSKSARKKKTQLRRESGVELGPAVQWMVEDWPPSPAFYSIHLAVPPPSFILLYYLFFWLIFYSLPSTNFSNATTNSPMPP